MRHHGRVGIAGLLCCCAVAVGYAQQTVYVNSDNGDDAWDGLCAVWDGGACGPKATIQAGIDAASDGDTVQIAAGTYVGDGNRDVDYHGLAITVASEGGPAGCVIDCEGDAPAFRFRNGESQAAILQGVTIANAGQSGIWCSGSSPTIDGCVITGCAAVSGGGIYSRNGDPIITNCLISGNTAGLGAGVYCFSGNPTVLDCVITHNTGGSAVRCHSSAATITGCTINGNSGAGVALYYSSAATIGNCTISGNTEGSGVYCHICDPTLYNCVVQGNRTHNTGGGVYCAYSNPVVTNCTITGNSAGVGGGVYCDPFSSPVLTNSIVWANLPAGIHEASPGNASVTYSDIQGGWTGEGNLEADPVLAFSADGHLLPGSPCIDGGTNAPFGGLPADDRDGTSRPLDGDGDATAVADMGAYERDLAAACLAVSADKVVLTTLAGQPTPPVQTLSIRNTGGGTATWSIETSCPWLAVAPAGGTSGGEVVTTELTADVSGLAPGAYTCTLTITAVAAVNSPRQVEVELVFGTTRLVPEEYGTLQAALDAAGEGDHIVVADGVYTGVGNKDLDFGGKALTLRSENGAGACVIDCEQDGQAFYFHSYETGAAVVDGFTITNGSIDGDGGAIGCMFSSPTIANCVIAGNVATFEGGGIHCYYSHPMLTNCTVDGNAAYYGGGGMACYLSSPTLVDCKFTNNAAESGGGLHCMGSSPVASNCLFGANVVSGDGGAIHCNYDSTPLLSGCTILGNRSAGDGSGVHCEDSAATLSNCLINANRADSNGGGVYCLEGGMTLTNCTCTGNAALGEGGAAYCADQADVTLINCTLLQNAAGGNGGGVFCAGSDVSPASESEATLVNCLLWQNLPRQIYAEEHGTVTATYCDIRGGWSGTGNIEVDPELIFGTDPHVRPGSPCIDAGTNDPLGGLPVGDVDGNPRPLDGDGDTVAVADIGACEYNAATTSLALSGDVFVFSAAEGRATPQVQLLSIRGTDGGLLDWTIDVPCDWVHVEPASGTADGGAATVRLSVDAGEMGVGAYACVLTVTDPRAVNAPRYVLVWLGVGEVLHVPADYACIQDAIDAAVDFDWVVLADGTYTGAGNRDLDFAGKLITVSSENGPAGCVIDGEESGRGFHFHTLEPAASVVDGLTIYRGRSLTSDSGGAILCDHAQPTISNCVLKQNVESKGAGICCLDAAPAIVDCTFERNGAGYGGGLYCENSTPSVSGCVFVGNTASYNGGAICCGEESEVTVVGSTLAEGVAAVGGGACCEDSALTLVDCLIQGNRTTDGGSTYYGGGVYCRDGDLGLRGCLIVGNRGSLGGGIACYGATGSAMISHCALVGNAASGGGAIQYSHDAGDGACLISDCVISGNVTTSPMAGGGGIRVTSSVPVTIVNCTIANNSKPGTSGGGGCTFVGGGTLVNSVVWGNTPDQIASYSTPAVVTYCDVQGGWAGAGNVNADPLLVGGGAGTWTADGVYHAEAGQLTLTDAAASWTVDELVGKYVSSPSSAYGSGRVQFAIVSNTATTLTVWADAWAIANDASWVTAGLDYQVHDYHLQAGSPCIDAADNTAVPADALDLDGDGDVAEATPFDLGGEQRFVDVPDVADTGNPDGVHPPVDMGAYEVQAALLHPGDVDCSGRVDYADIDRFVEALSHVGGVGWPYDCPWLNADCNGDGHVDYADIDAFVALIGTTYE